MAIEGDNNSGGHCPKFGIASVELTAHPAHAGGHFPACWTPTGRIVIQQAGALNVVNDEKRYPRRIALSGVAFQRDFTRTPTPDKPARFGTRFFLHINDVGS